MITTMYTIYDKKSQIYNPPQFCHNDQHAIRFFRMRFANDDTVIGQFPEDFDLYECGKFDDSNGKIKQGGVRFVANMATIMDLSKKWDQDEKDISK